MQEILSQDVDTHALISATPVVGQRYLRQSQCSRRAAEPVEPLRGVRVHCHLQSSVRCLTEPVSNPEPLTEGEVAILVDGLSDEVGFIYVMHHLGFGAYVGAGPGAERSRAVQSAIDSLRRLVDRGLVLVGYTQYVDGGPPGRLAPYEHVSESPDDVWRRLRSDSLSTEPGALDWSCWCVNSPAGDEVARRSQQA
jgi:hypothetical protein